MGYSKHMCLCRFTSVCRSFSAFLDSRSLLWRTLFWFRPSDSRPPGVTVLVFFEVLTGFWKTQTHKERLICWKHVREGALPQQHIINWNSRNTSYWCLKLLCLITNWRIQQKLSPLEGSFLSAGVDMFVGLRCCLTLNIWFSYPISSRGFAFFSHHHCKQVCPVMMWPLNWRLNWLSMFWYKVV